MNLPLVLIHGYSDQGASFQAWREKLSKTDPAWEIETISTCSYQSLTDEVTIKDLADGLDRALRVQFRNDDEAFDAIVHSTGMLVIREWFARDRRRLARLKHLVAIAPATFGSPLARQGRSWLGAVFKGQKHLGPDFLAAGDAVLDGLELASPYTWDLASRDIFNEKPFFDNSPDTPYVFVFCGTEPYGGIRELVNTPGMDGTVRWAGAGLNARRIILDLTRTSSEPATIDKWMGINVPVHLMSGMNHGTILSDPTDELVRLAKNALLVSSVGEFESWLTDANAHRRAAAVAADPEKGAWQQLIVRCTDQHDDPIRDFHVQLFEDNVLVPEFDDQRVAVYSRDASYRCFHVDVGKLLKRNSLTLKIMALSGSSWIDFQGFGWERSVGHLPVPTANERWDAVFDLTGELARDKSVLNAIRNGDLAFDNRRLFAPFTTTLLEIRLDRDAYPLDLAEISNLLKWDPRPSDIPVGGDKPRMGTAPTT
jgi:pimeloyl-ACP methyl ester carboxylesterase